MTQNINEIEVNGIKYVPKEKPVENIARRNMVIVRCETAGCFFGELSQSNMAEGTATLINARRLWYWSGAASLSQLAVDGTSKPNECKFPVSVSQISLAKVIEIMPCTAESVASIEGVKVWKT